jgi:hypothetical protein
MPSYHRVSIILYSYVVFLFEQGLEELQSQDLQEHSVPALSSCSRAQVFKPETEKCCANETYPTGRRVRISTIILPFAVDSAVR